MPRPATTEVLLNLALSSVEPYVLHNSEGPGPKGDHVGLLFRDIPPRDEVLLLAAFSEPEECDEVAELPPRSLAVRGLEKLVTPFYRKHERPDIVAPLSIEKRSTGSMPLSRMPGVSLALEEWRYSGGVKVDGWTYRFDHERALYKAIFRREGLAAQPGTPPAAWMVCDYVPSNGRHGRSFRTNRHVEYKADTAFKVPIFDLKWHDSDEIALRKAAHAYMIAKAIRSPRGSGIKTEVINSYILDTRI